MAVNLINRAVKIMTSPMTEWDAVAAEPANTQEIAVTYAAPLIVAGQLAVMLGLILFLKYPIQSALLQGVIGIALNFGLMLMVAAVIDGLAGNFGGEKNFARSLQVSAYSMTPYWIFTLLAIIPQLAIIALVLGLYSLVLIFLGIPKVKKPKKDQEAVYAITVIGATIILAIIAYVVVTQLVQAVQTPVYNYGYQ